MDETKLDFEDRKAEIENYFELLAIFDNDDTRLQYKKDGEVKSEKIQPQFQNILIANAFLILYNLIESTVRNSIIEIYTKIQDDKLSYHELSENLKKIWIKQTTDNLKEGNYQPETLRYYVFDLAKDILNKEIIILSKENMDFWEILMLRKSETLLIISVLIYRLMEEIWWKSREKEIVLLTGNKLFMMLVKIFLSSNYLFLKMKLLPIYRMSLKKLKYSFVINNMLPINRYHL